MIRILNTKFARVVTITAITILASLILINSDIISIGGSNSSLGADHKQLVGDSLVCTILIDNNLNTTRPGLKFTTDLIRKFSEQHRCAVEVSIKKGNNECWDEILTGETDVIIFNTNDSIPEPYGDYIEISVPIEESYSCAVKLGNDNILNSINYWVKHYKHSSEYKKNWERLLKSKSRGRFGFGLTRYSISAYDDLVKQYSKTIDWDWRLLSALIYQESKFNQGVVSRMGAIGLMQVMESTANRMGISDVYDPEQNIKAGTKELSRLIKRYKKMGCDSTNTILITLAAYNCGDGKIQHCMKVAKEEGLNPLDWNNIEMVIPLMTNGYKNEQVNIPPFKGRETIIHVENIIRQWELYSSSVVK